MIIRGFLCFLLIKTFQTHPQLVEILGLLKVDVLLGLYLDNDQTNVNSGSLHYVNIGFFLVGLPLKVGLRFFVRNGFFIFHWDAINDPR